MAQTKKRTDWTAPHWEAVAAEQIETPQTVFRRGREIMLRPNPNGGRKRLRHPENGGPLLTDGDCCLTGPHKVRRLFFQNQWHIIPSHESLLRWTFDGMAETPDGRTVEPDDRDSWLVLLNLV